MPSIVVPKANPKDATAKDPSLKSKVGTFLMKLASTDRTSGLHVEPIRHSADPRVRTARVDRFYRAVVFQIGQGDDAVYVFHGVWPHDDAINEAKEVSLQVNPRNGATEVIRVAEAVQKSQEGVTARQNQAMKRLQAAENATRALERQAAQVEAANERARQQVDAGSAQVESGVESGVSVAIRDDPPAWARPFTAAELHEQLGLDLALVTTALAAERESQLLDIAMAAEVPWQAEALLSLATGSTIKDVREEFGLHLPEDVSATGSDKDLLDGLRTPAARSSFTWAENDDELRKAIEVLDFQQWQLFLHPQQRVLVERDTAGASRISGGAGTGKTVVAVHRTTRLSRRNPAAHVLLTTFTRNLADDLHRQVSQLAPELALPDDFSEPGITVSGLDALAMTILQNAGDSILRVTASVLGRRRSRVFSGLRGRQSNPWNEALTVAGADLPEALRKPDFLESEYELIILPQQLTTVQRYLRVRRPGRGVALDRAKRAAVWKVVEAYRDYAAAADYTSFAERLVLAAAWLDACVADGGARPFQHVVVDEAQDLSPAHLLLLRALVAPGPNDLFLAEDSHQRIYGKKIVLSHYGIEVRGRSHRLTRNYRTTRQNLNFAFEILEPGDYQDLEGGAEQHRYLSPRSGPEPILLKAGNPAEELNMAAQLVRDWLDEDEASGQTAPETIAILTRDRNRCDAVVAGLAERGIDVRPVARDTALRGQPLVMTMHRAKGLEFRKVLLFDVSKDIIPRSVQEQSYSEQDRTDALLRERSLLYVAASRARDQLAISWNSAPSPLLEPVATKA
ncbi:MULTISPECIES: 3'-5' exonuclease [unclassified Actinobaculum]|uniref:3'-5' exonuclease n=1 Tax=unclassified Actinobaculum TaxID=2609299 RepID=UPI000D527D0C|nr:MULTISPECIES: 3'-5' exonuclease [unclassified Actinobaculum]AWE41874.1 DNA helicase UvrD [Actinobaculum sp. 313]RTE50208.1 ATP-dependent helicase [Actinobaculum sp. 352]